MGFLPTEKTKPKVNLADLTILLYGPSKIGKSTFCSRSDGALFLATEPGLNALETYQIPITTWDEMLKACGEIAGGKHNFRTVIIDTVDNAYKACAHYICQKMGVKHESELPYGKGFSLINNEFLRVLTKLGSLPYGLFLVSHSKEIEIKDRVGNVYTQITPTLPGKASEIVVGLVDMILYCDYAVERKEDGTTVTHRVIRTKSSPNYIAGDRHNVLPEAVPLSYQAFTKAFADGIEKKFGKAEENEVKKTRKPAKPETTPATPEIIKEEK